MRQAKQFQLNSSFKLNFTVNYQLYGQPFFSLLQIILQGRNHLLVKLW